VPLGLVKSTGTKDTIKTPGGTKFLANNQLAVFTTAGVEGEDMIPMSYANEDGFPPCLRVDRNGANGSLVRDEPIPSTPNLPEDEGTEDVTRNVGAAGGRGVSPLGVMGARWNPCDRFPLGGGSSEVQCTPDVFEIGPYFASHSARIKKMFDGFSSVLGAAFTIGMESLH